MTQSNKRSAFSVKSILVASIFAAGLILPQIAYAETAPTQIAPGSGVLVSDYRFELVDYETDYALNLGTPNTSKYGQISGSSVVNDVTTNDFSVYGRFIRSSDSAGLEHIVNKKSGANADPGYRITINTSDQLSMRFAGGGAGTLTTLSSQTIQTGVPYAFGVSFDRDNLATLWLYNLNNATLASTTTNISGEAGTATNGNMFTVGRAAATAAEYFPGLIDDITFKSGVVISQAQFLEFVTKNEITGLTPTSLYDMNDGIGTLATDEIGGTALTLTGSPTFTFQSSAPMVSFGTNFYADTVQVSGTYVNFTNTSIGSASTMVHDFGIGIQNGNGTITDVDASFVTVSLDCIMEGWECYSYYYYDTAHIPYSVRTSVGSSVTIIPQASYLTNATTFGLGAAPAVYNNSTGKYLKVKVSYDDPSSVTFASGSFIYADLGAPVDVGLLTLYFPSSTNVPKAADVYISSDGTNWGTPIKTNHQFTATAGFQSVDIPNTNGRYVKMEVTDWGSASAIQLGEFDIADQVGAVLIAETEAAFGGIWMFYSIIGSVITVAVILMILPKFGYNVI